LWVLFGATLFVAFFILGFFGRDVYRKAPPIPSRVLDEHGAVLLTRDDILTGQQVWQSTGGQQLGSIWGHGAYQAPDWSADWLHREATALLDVWAEDRGAASFAALGNEAQAVLRDRLVRELRTHTIDDTGDVHVSSARAVESLRWLRIIGDSVFLFGVAAFAARSAAAPAGAARRPI
jgi:nitric oxide reductase subunit B